MKESLVGIVFFVVLAAGTLLIYGISVDNLAGAQITNSTKATPSGVQQPPTQEQTQQQSKKQQITIPNHPPNANVGPDKKVNEGSTVVLDARHSSDPDDGNQITYSWRQIAGRPLVELGLSSDSSTASFTAPNVDRDTVITYVLTVTDENGAQDRDIVKVSVKNTDAGTSRLGTINSNNVLSTNTPGNTNSNNLVANQTTKALTNAEKNNNNNNNDNLNANNLSRILNTLNAATAANKQFSAAGSFTIQALSAVQAYPTNDLVNSRAWYQVIFRTGTTATIRQVDVTFPQGTNIANGQLVERSGLGGGTYTRSGQTITYTIASPVSVPTNTVLRLEFDNILNPSTAASNIAVIVTTKDTVGNTIESGNSFGYIIKQIGTGEIADGGITTPKIALDAVTTSRIKDLQVTQSKIGIGAVGTDRLATDAVTADKIAGVSKLIFSSCTVDFGVLNSQQALPKSCTVPGVANGDQVIATNNGVGAGSFQTEIELLGSFASTDTVSVWFRNDAAFAFDPNPILVSLMVFHP